MWSLQFGLASLALGFLTLATFGPWFHRGIAYALSFAAMGIATPGILLARAPPRTDGNENPSERLLGRMGASFSLFGGFLSAYLNGSLLLLAHPIFMIPATIVGLALALPREDRSRRDVGGMKLVSALVLVLISSGSIGTLRGVSAFCEISEPPSPLPTQVNGTQVEIELTEGYARVVIIKEFYNPDGVQKEGQVFFPLERGHELITDLRLKVGAVVYNATAENRTDALDKFLDGVRRGQEAALIQYDVSRDVYWVEVTIPPRQARTTITTLEMPLVKEDGFYTYDYRLSVDARHSVSYLRVHVRVTSVAPLEAVEIPSHSDIAIRRSGERVAEAFLNSTADAKGRDLTIRFRSAAVSAAQVAVGGERFVRFSMDASDPAFEAARRPSPRALLFLVDGSGSMTRGGRWSLVTRTVEETGRHLAGDERFGLAVFHGNSVRPLSDALEVWDAHAPQRVTAFLGANTPGGSTNLTVGLSRSVLWAEDAHREGLQPILILLTDGAATTNTDALAIENAYNRASFGGSMPVFAVAVQPGSHGQENLLRNVSHFSHGALVHLYGGDVQAAVADLLAAIRVPILRDVTTAFPSTPDADLATPSPQTVLEGGEVVAIARMGGAGGEPLTVRLAWEDRTGSPGIWETTFEGEQLPSSPSVSRQWILTRIHRLLEAQRVREDAATREALRVLAIGNKVVTPYTSLLVTLSPSHPPQQGGASASQSAGPFGFAFPPTWSPIEQQDRYARGFRADLGTPLLANGELDRMVLGSSEEAQDLESRATAAPYRGTFLTILEVDGELVGVRKGWLAGSPEVASATAATMACLALGLAVLLPRLVRRKLVRPPALR